MRSRLEELRLPLAEIRSAAREQLTGPALNSYGCGRLYAGGGQGVQPARGPRASGRGVGNREAKGRRARRRRCFGGMMWPGLPAMCLFAAETGNCASADTALDSRYSRSPVRREVGVATRQRQWDGADEVGDHGRRCHGATAHQGISCIEGLVCANRDGDSGFGTVRMHSVLARASLRF